VKLSIEDATTIISATRGELRDLGESSATQEARRHRLIMGRALLMVGGAIGHGQWTPFLKRVGIAPARAAHWMALARYVDKLPRPRDEVGFVYAVAGPAAAIKVGFATDIGRRMAELQTASPVELRLIAAIRGTRATEQALHRKLASFRMRGEWFRECDETLAIIVEEFQ
jgi:hypothetical protein